MVDYVRTGNALVRQFDAGPGESRAKSTVLGTLKSLVSTPHRVAILIFIVLPWLGGIWFFGLYASDRYVSETDFIVRSLTAKHSSGLDMILKTFGLSAAQDDANAIVDYIQSRDAVRALEQRLPLRKIWSVPEGDRLSRYPRVWSKDSDESLYKYYLDRVTVVRNLSSGVATLRVSAFRPQDAKDIAEALLFLGEQLANRMNDRAQRDAISGAQREVDLAQQRVLQAQADLTAFRNKELLVDPGSASAKTLELVANLSAQLAAVSANIREVSVNSPTGPAVAPLKAKATALEQQIGLERAKLAGNDSALSGKIATYEQLIMSREFADRALASSITMLETARQDARRQQVYIEPIVLPMLSDESTEPRRIRGILTVMFVSLVLFTLAWVVLSGAREHAEG
jgi:capsular polysaccharide transport system permease protein